MSGTTIGGAGGVGNSLFPIGTGDDVRPGEVASVGQGLAGAGGIVPAATVVAAGFAMMNIAQSLRNFGPGGSGAGGDFEARLADVMARIRDTSGTAETERVNNEQAVKSQNMKENQAKIEESQEKLEKAEAKRKSGNIFQRIAQAFQALGAVLMAVVGAALMAVPGFQVAGAMMIASGAMLMMSLINSLVAENNGGAGLLGSVAKAFGASEDVIKGLDYGMMGAMMVAGIAMAVFSGGGSVLGPSAALFKATGEAIKAAGTAISAATTALSAGAQVGSAVTSYQAAQLNSQASGLQAASLDLQAMMQQLDDMIDQALQMLLQANNAFNGMLDSVTSMMNDTADSLSSTRFAG